MKKFKQVDLVINFILILGFTIISLIKSNFNYVLAGYVAVGSWQLISILVHIMNNWFNQAGSKRAIYHRVIIVIVLLALLGSLFTWVLYVLFVLLVFSAPLLALYYTWLCYYELNVKMKRPLAILK